MQLRLVNTVTCYLVREQFELFFQGRSKRGRSPVERGGAARGHPPITDATRVPLAAG